MVKDPKSRKSKSTSSFKGTSRSQHKSSGNYAHAEELSYIVEDSECNKIKSLTRGAMMNHPMMSNLARAEKPPNSFDELIDTPIDFSTFVMNQLNIANLTQELLVGPAFNLLNSTCKSRTELEYHFEECHHVIPFDYFINNDLEYLKGGSLSRKYSTSITKTKVVTYEVQWIEDMVPNIWSPVKVVYDKHAYCVTSLKIMKWYDYDHLDETEVRREDQQLYTFKEGDFQRLLQNDIEDMLLLLVQQRLTNLTIDERYDLNVALRMFSRRIVIQRQNLRNRTAYTAYSDPQGVIYEDQNNRNRLMHTNELHKFSDGTLNYVRTALHDISLGIRMNYLPKKKWSNLDKRRAWVMIQDIDKQLFQIMLMRNLEKFVGGREYEEDLRLLKRAI
ncbi:hypothetical protein Tco_0984923 [Tanacetum coccineum]